MRSIILLALIFYGVFVDELERAICAPIPLQQATPKPRTPLESAEDGVLTTRGPNTLSAPTPPSPSMSTTPFVLPYCEAGPSRIILSDSEDEEEFVKASEQDETDQELLFNEPLSGSEAREVLKRALELMNPASKRPRTGQYDEMATILCKKMMGSSFVPHTQLISPDSKNDPTYCPDDDAPIIGPKRNVELHVMQRILELKDSGRTEKGIRAQYSWYRRDHLPGFRQCVARGHTHKNALEEINKHANARCEETRKNFGPLRGRMMQRWALEKAKEIGADWFKASDSWLANFKKKYDWVSRKVTKHRGRSEVDQQARIRESIAEFREGYATMSNYFPHRLIWNVDQTGFQYESAHIRIMDKKGQRDTELNVDDKNKVTHSYTAQPIITRDGRLLSPIFLCMQETTSSGKFGPKVQEEVNKQMREYKNVIVVASKSGKMSKELFHHWIARVLAPSVRREPPLNVSLEIQIIEEQLPRDDDWVNCLLWSRRMGVPRDREEADCRPKILLLADSWGGQTGDGVILDMIRRGVKIQQIPKLTTDVLQPLDVGFNRQYKKLWKRIEEEAWFQKMTRELNKRASIINMHSLMADQLSSPKYRDMIRFAWRHTDPNYNEAELSDPVPKKVQDINFNNVDSHTCEATNCTSQAFIRCAHCGKHLCLRHFLDRICFHYPYGNESFFENEEPEVEAQLEPFCRPLNITGGQATSTTESTFDQAMLPVDLGFSSSLG